MLFLAGCSAGRPARLAPQAVPPRALAVIKTAKSYLPEEERRPPEPRDCSDFVRRVFAANGMPLSGAAADLARVGEKIGSSRDLRMGDLVFFSGEKVSRLVGHVGIYVNNGIFIHLADPKQGVTMESLYSDYYRKRYLLSRRLIQ